MWALVFTCVVCSGVLLPVVCCVCITSRCCVRALIVSLRPMKTSWSVTTYSLHDRDWTSWTHFIRDSLMSWDGECRPTGCL